MSSRILDTSPTRQAHAGDTDRILSDVRTDRGLSDVTAGSSTANAETPSITANGHGGANLIEEIVVVGNNQKQCLNPDCSVLTRTVIMKPSRVDFRLLARYDPEEANRQFTLVEHDEQLRGLGIVTLLRLSFGR